jgi:indolepyruvate ferredoxin oxidoreductase beta subunit
MIFDGEAVMRTQIILAGIGGQGILFASKIFSEVGLRLGMNVLGSETHGMSQRGGSVIAHLKLGDFHSPVIRTGGADFLYSLDLNETYRTLAFLKRGGVCLVNMSDPDRFDKKILDHLGEKEITFRSFDAVGEACKIGWGRAANIILIGYSVGSELVAFSRQDVKSVLECVSRKKDVRMNVEAFELGFSHGSR